jgi:hypothetical protein
MVRKMAIFENIEPGERRRRPDAGGVTAIAQAARLIWFFRGMLVVQHRPLLLDDAPEATTPPGKDRRDVGRLISDGTPGRSRMAGPATGEPAKPGAGELRQAGAQEGQRRSAAVRRSVDRQQA